eukprot:5867409-Pyramimonas_sp.AAC.1
MELEHDPPLEVKQEVVLKFSMVHKPSMRASLWAAADSEAKHSLGGPCKKTIAGRGASGDRQARREQVGAEAPRRESSHGYGRT